jgi:hypothetical protein
LKHASEVAHENFFLLGTWALLMENKKIVAFLSVTVSL